MWAWTALLLAGACPAADSSGAARLKRADGSWKYTNRLIDTQSPYLLLHAHNPVDWYPWGPEALERARREDKPIFLSVGYSTCYWCHVMEREVFSDPQIAALMNQWFVNIKVDREERPDIDRIYMTATQVMTGHGGWPNSVFLTPELEPFFAGTYFPPKESYGRPGFPKVLAALHDAWVGRPDEVRASAGHLAAAVRQLESGRQGARIMPDTVLVGRALEAVKVRYDAANGGFGGAPKFPPATRLDFLLDAWQRQGDEAALDIVEHTLESMALGGIHDQVGGGFHRYATDAAWRVPHFEKMLYNQAELARVYARAYRLTGDEAWQRTATAVLDFVERELSASEGGFYSALDAQTDGVEGLYYLWTADDLEALLGDEADAFWEVYELAPMPDGDGEVLVALTPEDRGAAADSLQQRAEQWRRRLLKKRQERAYPLRDDKVVAAWNGMMIAALAEASTLPGGDGYYQRAARAADFVLVHMRDAQGGLRRVWRQGQLGGPAYLEDFAHVLDGLLRLYEVSGRRRWLAAARGVADGMVERFWDVEGGGFFFADGQEKLLARSKSGQDGALPSPNSVAVHGLLDLALWTGDGAYRRYAGETLAAFGGAMGASPENFVHLIAAAARYLEGAVGGGRMTAAALAADGLVQARAQLRPVGTDLQLEVELTVAEGWHINAHPASGDWLVPTSLTLNADMPIDVGEVIYPPGQRLRLGDGPEVAVYRGKAVLRARLRPAGPMPDAGATLRLLVQYQACDEQRCLPPAEWLGTVPLPGAGAAGP